MQTEFTPSNRTVATREATIEFVNKLRAAADANPISDLMASLKSNERACLIANAVSFDVRVRPTLDTYDNGIHSKWVMQLPANMDEATARKLAAAVDCPLVGVMGGESRKRTTDDLSDPNVEAKAIVLPSPSRRSRTPSTTRTAGPATRRCASDADGSLGTPVRRPA